MQADILQSTSTTIVLKVYLTDHVTPATGKTLAITISKNIAAFGNPSAGATNATEIASGWYYVTLSTTDTGTLGPLIVLGTASGCDNADQSYTVVKATNRGMTGIPDAAANANGGLPILSSSATTLAYTVSTVTTVTNQLTAAAIATGVWQDATAGDFTTASSIGKSLYTSGVVPGAANGLFIAGTNAATSITTGLTAHIIGTVDTVTTVTNQLTAAAIATGVWQDATAGDFTTASSIGKSLYTSGVVPGAANGLFIAGTNAATAITTGLTAHIIGTVDTLTTYTGNTPQTGDSYVRLGAPAGASVSVDIAELDTLIDAIPILTTVLSAPRAMDSIADGSVTLADALWGAYGATHAQQDASSGTSLVIKTASTATTLRTKALTLISPPATVPSKAV